MGKPAWGWLTFVGAAIALLAFDPCTRTTRRSASAKRWVPHLSGAFLIFTGIKMWIVAGHIPDTANNPLLKFLKRHLRVTEGLRGHAFSVRETDTKTGKLERFATPLFVALVLVLVGSKIPLVGLIGKIPAVISSTVTFGLIAGGVRVSPWKTRGQPAVAEPR